MIAMNISRTFIPMLVALTGASVCHADMIFNTTPTDIPDNNSLGISQDITLSGYISPVTSVEVSLVITGRNVGAYNGDFYVSLQHDSGYAVLLNRAGRTSSNPFGYSDNGFNITFTLAASDIHTYQAGGYTLGPSGELTGVWGADGRNVDPLLVLDSDAQTATLASFNGLDANGTWTLFVADTSLNGEGVLVEWGINVVPEPSAIALLALAGLLQITRRRARR